MTCGCHGLVVNAEVRYDPTRTGVIRRQFETDMAARFNKLKDAIFKEIVERNGFGISAPVVNEQVRRWDRLPDGTYKSSDGFSLRPSEGKKWSLIGPAGQVVTLPRATFDSADKVIGTTRWALPAQTPSLKGRFEFTRSSQKSEAFMTWLRKQAETDVLGIRVGTPMERAAQESWMNVYIESSYQRGLNRAGTQLRKAGATVDDSWLTTAFRRPIHADRVGMIFTRTFSDLKGITSAMDTQISRILAKGLIDGSGPEGIARAINERVDAIGITRARTLARTEVISAHAEGTLNGFEEAGVAGVDVEAEFVTGAGACPQCSALEGNTYTISEARGLLPVHPNCRCAWIPKVIGGTGIVLR